jgi:hypothetical protein
MLFARELAYAVSREGKIDRFLAPALLTRDNMPPDLGFVHLARISFGVR